MSTDGVSTDEDKDGRRADVVDLPARNRRRSRRSQGRTVMTSLLSDDAIPTSCDEDGEPLYARTELDRRCDALLACYDQSEPNPDAVLVSDAFFAITAPENLAHADEAVALLELLVRRAKHRTYYLLTKQLEALEASGLPHPTDDGPRRRA